MAAVVSKRDEDARAEAAEVEAAAAERDVQHAQSSEYDDERSLAIHAAAAAIAAGRPVPEHLQSAAAEAERRLRAMGWDGEEDDYDDDDDEDDEDELDENPYDTSKPRVLPAGSVPASMLDNAKKGAGSLDERIPALNLSTIADPTTKPMAYQAEFEAAMVKHEASGETALANESSAAVDAMLYGKGR